MRRRKLSPAELLIAIAALIFVFPVAMIFITSFKPDGEVVKFESIFPKHATLANFQEVLGTPEEIPLLRWFLNSLGISMATTLLVLCVASLSAYAFARLELPGKKWVFPLVIGTLMVPGQILLVPVYLELNALHWLDSPLALIVPAGGSAFGFFMLHSFFMGIPRELEEAAEIDGCSRFGIFWNVIIPLSKSPLAALAIFTFVGSWNDFLGPLVYLDSVDHYTLPVGVALFQSSYASEYGLTLAAGVLCTLPTLLAFLIFQRHILAGMASSGLKE
jgi:multiple sugar transport system permease protein